MSRKKQVLEHPVSEETKQTYEGFSWPGLLFTPIWCILKGLYMQAIIALIIPFGFVMWVIVGFKGNEWHYEKLIQKGYKPTKKKKIKPDHDYNKKLY